MRRTPELAWTAPYRASGSRSPGRLPSGGFLPVTHEARASVGPIIDCNVHLWDQADNPIFWLSDRTAVQDMLGNYDNLPDKYTLADYRQAVAGHDIRGVIWSDAGAADPLAAADWVSRQPGGPPPVVAIVTLGDPTSPSFADLVARCQERPMIRSIRIRLVPGLSGPIGSGDVLGDPLVHDNLTLLAGSGLVATVEAVSSQLDSVTRLAAAFPDLKIIVDHFGWPEAGTDLDSHLLRLATLAAFGNVATRIDAIGTIFGDWDVGQIRAWLLDVKGLFGSHRCMLGSDLPIENLRSGFGSLYAAYDAIFSTASDDERSWLFHRSAEHWYA